MPKTSVNIDVSELRELLEQIRNASNQALKLVDHAIIATAIDMETDLKKTISSGSRSGRMYTRGGKQGQRSAPGEPPKTDTGTLASSIRQVSSFMSAEVGSLENVANYGDFLEQGTVNMGERPLFKPMRDKYSPIIAKRVTIAIKRSGLVE